MPFYLKWARSISLLVFFLFWQISAMIVASDLLPSPIQVIISMWEHFESGELMMHLGITLRRVTISFVIAMIIGVALGILMGSRNIWDKFLDSIIILALNIPALVTIILC